MISGFLRKTLVTLAFGASFVCADVGFGLTASTPYLFFRPVPVIGIEMDVYGEERIHRPFAELMVVDGEEDYGLFHLGAGYSLLFNIAAGFHIGPEFGFIVTTQFIEQSGRHYPEQTAQLSVVGLTTSYLITGNSLSAEVGHKVRFGYAFRDKGDYSGIGLCPILYVRFGVSP